MSKYAEFTVNVNNYQNGNKTIINPPKEHKKIKPNKIKKAIQTSVVFFNKSAQLVNSKVGSYTGNRVATENRQQIITMAGIATSIILNPAVGIGATAIYTVNNLVDFNIRQQNSREESNYRSSLLGSMTTSKSRWRGNYR